MQQENNNRVIINTGNNPIIHADTHHTKISNYGVTGIISGIVSAVISLLVKFLF